MDSRYYRTYGLTIRSDIPLFDVPALSRVGEVDVQIRHAEQPLRSVPRPSKSVNVLEHNGAVYIASVMGRIAVQEGRTAIVDPAPGYSAAEVLDVYIIPVMGLIEHQRGHLTLHASAVHLGEHAVAFIGPKGAGKSTTSSLFHARGHSVITDDLVAMTYEASTQPHVHYGLPWIKLHPEALSTVLGEAPDAYRPVLTGVAKRVRPLSLESAPADPVPLARIYVLSYHNKPHKDTHLKALSVREACLLVLGQTYAPMVLDQDRNPELLTHCARLVREVPVKLLARRSGLEDAAAIYDVVMADL